jgi:Gram-negative bacterial TonB protein C-terminal/PilZ domain
MDQPSPRPKIAGLTSPVQQAEMTLLLAGRWPPLKPLPIFKCETDEHRTSIEFDKTRGEWVCRKTSLPSNKVKELRGGLREIAMALPRGRGGVYAEDAAADPPEQELEKDAGRRIQAILEWKENCESGALYSGLQGYLSKSEQDDIDESIRLTLTARQLQFNAKNVADVFDALAKAGGKLALLLEAAQRNKTLQEADVAPKVQAATPNAERHASIEGSHPRRDRRLQTRTTLASCAYSALDDSNGGIVLNISETGMAVATAAPLVLADYLPHTRFRLPNIEQRFKVSAQVVWLAESKKTVGIRFVDLTAEARNQIANWIACEKRSAGVEGSAPAPVENLIAATLESFAAGPTGSVTSGQDRPFSPELIARAVSRSPEIVTPETSDGNASSLVEDLPTRVHDNSSVAVFGSRIRPRKSQSPANSIENSPSGSYVLVLSGFHVAAAVFLLAAISLAVGLAAVRGPLGSRLRETQKSLPATNHTSQALLNHAYETTSQASAPLDANASATPAVNPTALAKAESKSENPATRSFGQPPEDPTASVASSAPASPVATQSFPDFDKPEASPERGGGPGRNEPTPAVSQPAHSPTAGVPMPGVPASPAPRVVLPATRAIPHLSSPSTILFTGPGDIRKPFRLILPERPIAASSSFAITSQLSVLVSPVRGRAPAGEPARLQAGELVSFVWPHYPKPGDRHGPSETVKVRATIGEFGQVMDVKRVSGSLSLLSAAMSALRLWRYKPTLLNNSPVEVQQDVTIEFRTPKRSPRVASHAISKDGRKFSTAVEAAFSSVSNSLAETNPGQEGEEVVN